MSEFSIPVDLNNPGQVFASLGFLEAADELLGEAEGGFDWNQRGISRFVLRASGNENPIAFVLEFLATAEPKRWAPVGYTDPPPKKGKVKTENDADEDDESPDEAAAVGGLPDLELQPSFPAKKGDRMSLPIGVGGGNRPTVQLAHLIHALQGFAKGGCTKY